LVSGYAHVFVALSVVIVTLPAVLRSVSRPYCDGLYGRACEWPCGPVCVCVCVCARACVCAWPVEPISPRAAVADAHWLARAAATDENCPRSRSADPEASGKDGDWAGGAIRLGGLDDGDVIRVTWRCRCISFSAPFVPRSLSSAAGTPASPLRVLETDCQSSSL